MLIIIALPDSNAHGRLGAFYGEVHTLTSLSHKIAN
jgi:hypothetical protein